MVYALFICHMWVYAYKSLEREAVAQWLMRVIDDSLLADIFLVVVYLKVQIYEVNRYS